jgi:hypothetical protein
MSQVKENNTVKNYITGKLSDGQVLIALKERTVRIYFRTRAFNSRF